ncbi:MAG: flagellar motor switch protein FliN [Granulosicoccus sp.]|nr:flagellar motor switch protein FliN [Granulosicoccus sp.]
MSDAPDEAEAVEPEPDAAVPETATGNAVSAPVAEDAGAATAANVGLIMDIPVTVSMELGRTKMSIKDLLAMNPGSVIELQRLANEPMEILVNGTLVAHGEAVRVGERYGVRLTSVITAGERLKKVNGL